MKEMSVYKAYAGIGSRKTPESVLNQMTQLAIFLELRGYTLRSGHADGADLAFEHGVRENKEIYLSWKGFNGSDSQWINPSIDAYHIAKQFHPNWNACKPGARALMARNSHQMLGPMLKQPVEFVVCWTPDGQASGGTGQALRIAEAYNIPIYNLHNPNKLNELIDYILEMYNENGRHHMAT